MRKKKPDSEVTSDAALGGEPAPPPAAIVPEAHHAQPLGAVVACVKVPETSTVVCGVVVSGPKPEPKPQPTSLAGNEPAAKSDE